MRIVFALLALLFSAVGLAQQTLFMNAPVGYNSSFAGSATAPRLSTYNSSIGNNKFEGNSIDLPSVESNTFWFSGNYDWYANSVRGGLSVRTTVGRSFTRSSIYFNEADTTIENIFESSFSSQNLYAAYAPKFNYNSMGISPSVFFGLGNGSLSNNLFSLNNEPIDDPFFTRINYQNRLLYDLGFGLLVNKKDWFVGYKLDGINNRLPKNVNPTPFRNNNLNHYLQFGKIYSDRHSK